MEAGIGYACTRPPSLIGLEAPRQRQLDQQLMQAIRCRRITQPNLSGKRVFPWRLTAATVSVTCTSATRGRFGYMCGP